ncbi:MAG: branched-chain amino acid ABC transporter permease [Chloroflexota bacterium]|nr:MAG: branched-chain amino acid ABC transporter permease [Chloroflexota bacterium]
MATTTAPVPRSSSIFELAIKKRWLGKAFLISIALIALWRIIIAIQANPILFLQQVVNGIQLGFVYALIALGYTMVYGIVRLINFAHGDVFMVGAFISFFGITRFQLHLWLGNVAPGLPLWVTIGVGSVSVVVLAMIVCAWLSYVIERIAYKPLRNAPRISALITAIGVSFFLEYFAALQFVFTPNFITFKRPFPVQTWMIGSNGIQTLAESQESASNGIIFSNIALIIIISSIILLLLLQYVVQKTRIGKAMRAVAYDKPTARLMGINVDGIISVTFAIGASLAGAAGMLYAIAYPSIVFGMGIIPGLKAFVAAVLGGIGSIPGALIGALIMGQAENLSAAYISSPMRDAIAFTILIIVLLVRPTGIFGEPSREKA